MCRMQDAKPCHVVCRARAEGGWRLLLRVGGFGSPVDHPSARLDGLKTRESRPELLHLFECFVQGASRMGGLNEYCMASRGIEVAFLTPAVKDRVSQTCVKLKGIRITQHTLWKRDPFAERPCLDRFASPPDVGIVPSLTRTVHDECSDAGNKIRFDVGPRRHPSSMAHRSAKLPGPRPPP